MSDQNNDKPKKVATPEEKAAAAAAAKAAAEARRKAKEQAALEAEQEVKAETPVTEENDGIADGGVAETPTVGINETSPDPAALEAQATEQPEQPQEKRKPTPEEKAAAAAAAKAAAEARRKAKEAAESGATSEVAPVQSEEQPAERRKPTPEEKAAAAAAAKAAAEARRIAKEAEASGEAAAPADGDAPAKKQFTPEEKAAAAAAARAAAEERRKAKEAAAGGTGEGASDDEKALAAAKAKAAAAAKAKAAAAAKAKAAGAEGAQAAGDAEQAAPKEPSKNQPVLDKIVKLITEQFGAEVLDDSYINENSKEDPTIVVKNDRWLEVASFLRNNPELSFNYLVNLMGVDYEDSMEVVYYLQSFAQGYVLMVKVKTERENASVASVTPIWAGANWNEREAYDLLGITFTGHPNLVRIMMTDDWVGHPLRKDYEPLDQGV